MTATTSSNLKATLIAATLLAIAIPSAKVSASEEVAGDEGKCAFSKQLQDYSPRLEFEQNLKAAREASTSRFGETFSHTVQMRTKDGHIMDIDTFSVDCLSCHDGINAKGKDIRMKNSRHSGSIDMTSVSGSHPIGMDYGSYAYAGNGFKHMGALKSDMELIDGKVGCLTCHNPLNKGKNHLVFENNDSNLCYSCHAR